MHHFFKKTLFTFLLLSVFGYAFTSISHAQRTSPTPSVTPEATAEAEIATPAAALVAEAKGQQDITSTTPQTKGRLARLLDDNPIGQFSWHNFIQHGIRQGVEQGVPANILVLILLFPMIASFIAISRHFIGVEGFGVYIPAVLSVTLLSTGIISGLLFFFVIILTVIIARAIVKRFRLQYLPRTAVILWTVSLTVFGVLLLSPALLKIGIDVVAVSIFPLLVLILLSENFIEAQLVGTQSRAFQLTAETIILAVISTLFIRTQIVQDFVILHPEMTILSVLLLDLAVGKYTGLRVSEYLRFKTLIDREE